MSSPEDEARFLVVSAELERATDVYELALRWRAVTHDDWSTEHQTKLECLVARHLAILVPTPTLEPDEGSGVTRRLVDVWTPKR